MEKGITAIAMEMTMSIMKKNITATAMRMTMERSTIATVMKRNIIMRKDTITTTGKAIIMSTAI